MSRQGPSHFGAGIPKQPRRGANRSKYHRLTQSAGVGYCGDDIAVAQTGPKMSITSLISHDNSRWLIPVYVFIAAFSLFDFFERRMSLQARQNLTNFLRGFRYESYLGDLPIFVQEWFTLIFGRRHLSVRCIKMSALLSVLSVLWSFGFTYLYNRQALIKIVAATPQFITALSENLAKNPKFHDLARYTDILGGWWVSAFVMVLWIGWCVIPDYLALLKTRIMLMILKHTHPTFGTLLTTGVVDFFVAVWLFLTSITILPSILISIYIFAHATSPLSSENFVILFFVVLGLLFAFISALFAATGAMFVVIPISNLFWASALPSIWLWGYIFAAILTRSLLSSKSSLRRLVYLLDIDNHAVRSLGVVVGVVLALGFLIGLLMLTIV